MEMTNGGADEEKKSRYFFDWNGNDTLFSGMFKENKRRTGERTSDNAGTD